MQKARRHPKRAPTDCRCTVSGSISLPYSGYFSPFPHGTCSLSVTQEYLALPDGAGRFTQSFTGFALLRIQTSLTHFHLQDYHLLRCRFPTVFNFTRQYMSSVLQPLQGRNLAGLGSSPFARHYLGNNYCYLLLRVLRCFSSPGLPSIAGISTSQ